MKKYTSPTVDIVKFSRKDVIVNLASSRDDLPDHETEIDYN